MLYISHKLYAFMRKRLAFRAWFYFRIGYSTYLSFTLAVTTTLVSVYYLAIENVPTLKEIFPSFYIWGASVITIGMPLAIYLGWLHLKRSKAFSSEMDIAKESDPYYYKLPPGYWKEVLTPMWLEIMMLNLKIINKEDLTDEETKRIDKLKNLTQKLIDGGYVGSPKHSKHHDESM